MEDGIRRLTRDIRSPCLTNTDAITEGHRAGPSLLYILLPLQKTYSRQFMMHELFAEILWAAARGARVLPWTGKPTKPLSNTGSPMPLS